MPAKPSFNILLISCYESGHQPMGLALPAAFLRARGFETEMLDLAVTPLTSNAVSQAHFIGISVPMHTAMRVGVETAQRIRKTNPEAHLCCYGLYAWMNADFLFRENLADSVLAGNFEGTLAKLVEALAGGANAASVPGVTTPGHLGKMALERILFPLPERRQLPGLKQYARLRQNGEDFLAGYTEASRGCLHTCAHCPVVPIYQGRFFVNPVEQVMADIRQQAAAGAQHFSFGDPDFLNGPRHAMRVAQAFHAEFPSMTFDFTTKIEHILKNHQLLTDLRALGALFVISAFESTSDHILQHLEKGHSAADLDLALDILNNAGLHIHPTWVPFTPWTSMQDYLDLLDWIRSRDLIAQVAPIQLAIRLLIPPRSQLLKSRSAYKWIGTLDEANFSYRWEHDDPIMDRLYDEVATLVEIEGDGDPFQVFRSVESIAHKLAGKALPAQGTARTTRRPPRLTEDWFC